VVASPSFIVGGLHKNIYTIREEQKEEKYTGMLTMWHIVSFPTASQSGVSYLSGRIARFEKQNAYVFIELEGLTPAEARQRMDAGEFPDIVSFPLGFFSNYNRLVNLPNFAFFMPAYAGSDSAHVYPYMADSYVLACNQNLFMEQGVPFPLDGVISTDNFYYALQTLSFDKSDKKKTHVYPLGFTTNAELAPQITLLYPATSEDNEEILDYTPTGQAVGTYDLDFSDGTESFLLGTSGMLVCSRSEYAALLNNERSSQLNPGSISISNYTDMVQFVGAARSADPVKQQMCQDFAAFLISESSQRALESTGMLPTVNLEEIYTDEPDLADLYQQIGYYGIIPSGAKFAALKSELATVCKAALLGDVRAIARIHNLL